MGHRLMTHSTQLIPKMISNMPETKNLGVEQKGERMSRTARDGSQR
jgi:hypothetical protein